ncbi:MAG: hypothetical protein A2V88_12360 [Elusimicrobia bacterium RBG_16_66_12]|nr:MAG: hypothetical protein A2V88_12360 [Elusimicrobia bacterium RBG_16_66_12]
MTDIGSVTPDADGSAASFDAGNDEGTGTLIVTAGGKSATVLVTVSGGAQTVGEQMAQPASIGLLAAIAVLAAICVLLFMRNQQLSKRLKEGPGQTGGPGEGQA